MRTGLLPRWVWTEVSRALDLSALGMVEDQDTGATIPRWRDINTDLMERDEEPGRLRPAANAPTLRGVPLSPNDYAAEIEAGFEQMYRFLMERRGELLAPDGPLAALAHQSVRWIWRGTRGYSLLLTKALEPGYLRDGADRSVQLDLLSRALLLEETRPRDWPLVEEERQSLERHDVPYFTASSNRDGLDLAPGGTVEGLFQEPCYARVLSRLRELDDRDLERQKSFIHATLLARVGEAHRAPAPTEEVSDTLDLQHVEALAPEELASEAVAIAEQLRRLALGDLDSGVTWMTLRLLPGSHKFQLELAGPDLYSGACGMALFLAALELVTGGAGFRDLALAVLQPLRQDLRSRYAYRFARDLGLGGACGIGSFVYALTRAGGMLGEPGLLEDARAAAALITPERIEADRVFDFLSGSAGTIPGLLALHEATGAAEPLERAVDCGRHLLANRMKSEFGWRAWGPVEHQMLAGFSHGAAGISSALLRLYAVTRDADFKDAAIEAILYEDRLFSPAHQNWADLRRREPGAAPTSFHMATWCHGGPGIALARLAGLTALDTPPIREAVEAGVCTALRHGLAAPDHLCCGNLGRVEILLEAGQRLSRPELIAAAQQRAAWVVRRARQRGVYQLDWDVQGGVCMPGMFQGVSGIGYSLLHLAYPDRIPSVLLAG